jgi:antitoxin ParD1/3/4
MNISLPPELTRLIKRKIATGRYASATEVVREALERMAEDDRDLEKAAATLRRQISTGMAASKAGRVRDGETVMAELLARVQKTGRSRRRR